MAISLEDLLRTFVLMGVPLVPIGCVGASSCPDHPQVSRQYVEIENPARATADGGLSRVTATAYDHCVDTLDCTELCMQHFVGAEVKACHRVPTDAFVSGEERVAVQADVIFICEGRRPEGVGRVPEPLRSRCPVGATFARAAFLEAVSVPAFLRLARELEAHGAPSVLVTDARRAARDEVRHVRFMTALARRHGAEPPASPAELPSSIRTLEAVATENAAEGCVRETVGAVVAREQAGRAADRNVRSTLRAIARDEAQHAELAFRINDWAAMRLGPSARQRVRAAMLSELDTLAAEVDATDLSVAEIQNAGMPPKATSRAIVAGLRRVLAA